ncbi:MAG: aspartate aminotransferase family protein [Candidatus Caldarchaeum sp.]|nr:aspartate aminotransferase family protein [Candidatus Caldarchaeum sp.]
MNSSSKDTVSNLWKYVSSGISPTHPVVLSRGFNAMLQDVDGKEYIDFTSGIGVTNLGHAHPELVQVLKEQAEKLWHMAIPVAAYESMIALARSVAEITPTGYEKKTAFFNSGAEAVENAVKAVRKATKRQTILAFENSFHGRTALAMALTGKYSPYKVDFEPFAPGVELVPYPYCYRCPFGHEYPPCCMQTIEYLRNHFVHTRVPGDKIAAVIAEPIQGEGGFVVPPDNFFKELKKFLDEHGIKLIIDEIQTGFGRTGKLFAVEHFGVEPDLITFGKAIANGLPLSGMVGRQEILDSLHPGGLGGTFVGNPIACAVATKVIEIFQRDRLHERAAKLGSIAEKRLREMFEEYPLIGDVRGKGLMLAVELVSDRRSKKPAQQAAKKILDKARQHGLLLLKAGLHNNVVRLHPPITIQNETFEKGLDLFEETVKEVSKEES